MLPKLSTSKMKNDLNRLDSNIGKWGEGGWGGEGQLKATKQIIRNYMILQS